MAISVNTRKLQLAENLVLHVDIEFNHDTGSMETFLAEIHEVPEKELTKFYPSLPSTNRRALLHSYGDRIKEFSATFALADILLSEATPSKIRRTLESRLLKAEAIKARRYQICIKIRHQSINQDASLTESWLANFLTLDPSAMVSETGAATLGEIKGAIAYAADATTEIS